MLLGLVVHSVAILKPEKIIKLHISHEKSIIIVTGLTPLCFSALLGHNKSQRLDVCVCAAVCESEKEGRKKA